MMTTTVTAPVRPPTDVRAVQRRALALLMLGETLGSVALSIGFAVVGILAAQLAGSTIAASAHIATRSAGDTRVQGITETTMAVVSAAGAAASGPIMALWGFDGLITLAGLLTLALLVAVTRIRPPRGARPGHPIRVQEGGAS